MAAASGFEWMPRNSCSRPSTLFRTYIITLPFVGDSRFNVVRFKRLYILTTGIIGMCILRMLGVAKTLLTKLVYNNYCKKYHETKEPARSKHYRYNG